MQSSKKPNYLENNLIVLKNKAMDYITAGVGCNCLVVLFETGILDVLLKNGYISSKEIKIFGETTCINSALITLEKSEVVQKKDNAFYITEFGRTLSEYIGLITIFFDGYANLIAQQGQVVQNEIKDKKKFIKGAAVSKASVLISENMIDPVIIREIIGVNLSGTICDLGCGYAIMLSKICQETGNPGLGFDRDPKVVEQARKSLEQLNITIEVGDIANLHSQWEDVVILIQCHVFHDFTPEQKCIDIMNSYRAVFPNMKCFFYIDTVAPSPAKNELFPGFDYVHGLFGIPTRTHEETLRMFSASMYKVIKEVPLDLPNTFLWLLSLCKTKTHTMDSSSMNKNVELNRTHAKRAVSFEESVENLKKKIALRGDLPHVTCTFQLEVIEQLRSFPLGRFILERRGTNGFWTDYIISHPTRGRVSGLNIEGVAFTALEDWFLNQCPIVIAHQERFAIFQKLTQNLLKNYITLASIPCGLMRDLITLDFSSITHFELLGIDIDPESLSLARQLAHQKGITNIRLIQKNAWELDMEQEIDVITSSGLNVYEPDRKRVLDLYKKLFTALRPGGHLIISVLTYPPGEEKKTDWNTTNISSETLLLNQILHKDILDIAWRNFRTSSELEEEFKQVGFSNISIHFDKHRIFPTILAKKPM